MHRVKWKWKKSFDKQCSSRDSWWTVVHPQFRIIHSVVNVFETHWECVRYAVFLSGRESVIFSLSNARWHLSDIRMWYTRFLAHIDLLLTARSSLVTFSNGQSRENICVYVVWPVSAMHIVYHRAIEPIDSIPIVFCNNPIEFVFLWHCAVVASIIFDMRYASSSASLDE